MDSRTRGSPESRTGGGANLERQLIRESFGAPVRKSGMETFTNQQEAKPKLSSQKVWVLSVNWWQIYKYVR
jgi:hypothetical protein